MALTVRWMIRKDMVEVLEIENRSRSKPWTEDEFIKKLRKRNCIGMVADLDDKIVGYIVYELHKTYIQIHNIACLDKRQGVGKKMIGKMIGKLSSDKRRRLKINVNERNLSAQLFLKAMGFRAVNIVGDDYQMHFKVKQDALV